MERSGLGGLDGTVWIRWPGLGGLDGAVWIRWSRLSGLDGAVWIEWSGWSGLDGAVWIERSERIAAVKHSGTNRKPGWLWFQVVPGCHGSRCSADLRGYQSIGPEFCAENKRETAAPCFTDFS